MILGRRWETGFCRFAAFFLLSSLHCRFFVSCFVCVYSFARCLYTENLFSSQAFFLCRITCSFSCHIQFSLRIAFRPPPHTARDPWDSPPSRNDPAILLSGMLTGLFSTGSCRCFHFFFSLHLYISRSFSLCQHFFDVFGKFFSRKSLRPFAGIKKRGARPGHTAFLISYYQHRTASA